MYRRFSKRYVSCKVMFDSLCVTVGREDFSLPPFHSAGHRCCNCPEASYEKENQVRGPLSKYNL